MPLRPEHAHHLLSSVDPGRHNREGRPVGLRDGALLALVAAGLTSAEIAALRGTFVRMVGGHLRVTVRRHGVPWTATLPTELGAPVLAWLSETRLWAEPEPVFRGPGGPLSAAAIRQILTRHRRRGGAPVRRPHRSHR